ncbi:MAG: bifunctional glycosyltransferase family 2/GtrA family protein [Bacillota bacterium]|nr:bifunctional glycosyltransferase family 2/GtrA family protein [Bacillota bacterium]
MTQKDIAIIIPSLNPDEKFTRVVDGMIAAGFSRIVLVDDGSDENHKKPFELAIQNPMCTLLVHETNQGKGQALKDAFSYVYEKLPEIEAVITIDGDGQHTPEDSIKLANKLIDKPDNIVFGCRDFDQPNVPKRNRFGNKTTSLVFKIFFGMNLSDTQTGLRGIPRKYLKDFSHEVEGTRFEYESNMLIYMSANNIPFTQVPIKTLYIEENKSSHFRPIRDSIRIYGPILKHARGFMFIVTGCTCTLIDLIAYTLFLSAFAGMNNLWLQNLICNGAARVISAVINYSMNRKWVFHNTGPFWKGATKYFVIAAGKLIISWIIQTPVFNLLKLTGILRTIAKGVIDLILAFVSYLVQKHWVFKQ